MRAVANFQPPVADRFDQEAECDAWGAGSAHDPDSIRSQPATRSLAKRDFPLVLVVP